MAHNRDRLDWKIVARTTLTSVVVVCCLAVWNELPVRIPERAVQWDTFEVVFSILCLSVLSLIFNRFVGFNGDPVYLLYSLAALVFVQGIATAVGSSIYILSMVGMISLLIVFCYRVLSVRADYDRQPSADS